MFTGFAGTNSISFAKSGNFSPSFTHSANPYWKPTVCKPLLKAKASEFKKMDMNGAYVLVAGDGSRLNQYSNSDKGDAEIIEGWGELF